MKNSITVVFFGTAEFAIPSLEALVKSGYLVAGVITRPDEPAGRKLELTPPPVKVWAEKHGIPVYQPVSLEPGAWSLEELPEADIFIVAAYGKIIPKKILDIAKYGALNVHPSLLPRWRGPSPIQYTILNEDAETGVTIIKMDELMDHGDIVSSFKFQVSSLKFRYPELHDALAKEGAKLLIQTLPKWIAEEITPASQDHAKATYSQKLTKESGRIDWSKSAAEIERMVRAFTPWPGAWTIWHENDTQKHIRIDQAEADEATNEERLTENSPGFVWQDQKKRLLVITGKGSVAIRKLTLEGKPSTDAESFLRGHPAILKTLLV